MRDTHISEAYSLYRRFEEKHRRKPWSKKSFEGTIYFNAYLNGKMIVSIPCYDIFPYLQVRSISSLRLNTKDRQVYKYIGFATRRLIYEMCAYGKEKGHTFIGLGAVTETTKQKKNVAQFKKFFAPRIETEYTYTYQSRRFALFNKLRYLFS